MSVVLADKNADVPGDNPDATLMMLGGVAGTVRAPMTVGSKDEPVKNFGTVKTGVITNTANGGTGMNVAGVVAFTVGVKDQELKLAVKEDVVTFLKPLLEDCGNVAQSKQVIVSNLQNIYMIATNTIVEQGYDYSVDIYVTEETFSEKVYGDLTFPAGDYQALRIDIGEAKGQNWWGIMYPPLCFMDDTTMVVSDEGKEALAENLTPQEYAELFMNADVKLESKLWNWIVRE